MFYDEIKYTHFYNWFKLVKDKKYLGIYVCYNDRYQRLNKIEYEGKFKYDILHTSEEFIKYSSTAYINHKIWTRTDPMPTEEEFKDICENLKHKWPEIIKKIKMFKKLEKIEQDFNINIGE